MGMKRRMAWLGICILILILGTTGIWFFSMKRTLNRPQQSYTRMTFWTVSEGYADYMRSCVEQYNAQTQEERIELDIQVYSREFIVDQINKSLLKDDQSPDLVDIRFMDMHRFVNSAEHSMFLYPLNSLLSEQERENNQSFDAFSFNNTLLALPYGSGEMVAFVNRQIMEQVGMEREELGEWNRFLSWGETLSRNGVALFALDVNNFDLMLAMMLQCDAQLSEASDNTEIVHSDAYQQTHQLLIQLVRKGWAVIPEELDIYNQYFYKSFEEGECLCIFAPLEYASELIRNVPDMSGKVSIYPLPGVEVNQAAPYVAQYGTAILAKGKNIRLAKSFLQFAKVGEERYQEMADTLCVGKLSEETQAQHSVPENDAFLEYFGEDAFAAFTNVDKRYFNGASRLPEAVVPLAADLLGACEE